jgi:hypothetical protein
MSVTQTIEVPANHRLIIDVPQEVPAGKVILTFTPATSSASQSIDDSLDFEGECPLCAKSHTPNAETAAAIREGRAMMRGEIPAKRFHSLEELLTDLRSQ